MTVDELLRSSRDPGQLAHRICRAYRDHDPVRLCAVLGLPKFADGLSALDALAVIARLPSTPESAATAERRFALRAGSLISLFESGDHTCSQ